MVFCVVIMSGELLLVVVIVILKSFVIDLIMLFFLNFCVNICFNIFGVDIFEKFEFEFEFVVLVFCVQYFQVCVNMIILSLFFDIFDGNGYFFLLDERVRVGNFGYVVLLL